MKRNVDDENVVCKAVPETDTNHEEEADKRTMKRLQEIGNSIHSSIQLTIEFPSNNKNGRVPILDTEQWIEEVEINGEKKQQIIFSHYTKPVK